MKVLLLGAISQVGRAYIEAVIGERVQIVEADRADPPDALAGVFAEAEVIVASAYRADDPPAPKLRLVHVPNAGLDSIDLSAVPDGAAVCNVFEHDIGIGEYVLAAMLDWTVDLAGYDARFRTLDWSGTPRLSGPTRKELYGQTVLCIGYGTIGQAVAARARAFGMKVIAATRTPRDLAPAPDEMGAMEDLETLLPKADFVVVACPLTEETTGLVGAAELAAMKPTAVLINVARGAIVDALALYDALTAGRIGGAVLDTWYSYPDEPGERVEPAPAPLWTLDNVIVSPHCSGWTEGLIERRFTVVGENIRRLMDGEALVNRVHPAS